MVMTWPTCLRDIIDRPDASSYIAWNCAVYIDDAWHDVHNSWYDVKFVSGEEASMFLTAVLQTAQGCT